MNNLAELDKRELAKLGFGQGYVDATGFKPRSVMAAPLFRAEGSLLGVVQIIDSTNASGVFDERDEEAFIRLATHGALAIANIEVTKQAMKKWVFDLDFATKLAICRTSWLTYTTIFPQELL